VTYIRATSRANLDALKIRQQIAAAEVERAERELAEISDVEQDLYRLARRKELVTTQLQQGAGTDHYAPRTTCTATNHPRRA